MRTSENNSVSTVDPTLSSLIAEAGDPLKGYLTHKNRIDLSHTCQTLFKAFKVDPDEKAISELANHVLWNRTDAVMEILEAAKSNQALLQSLLTTTVTMPVKLPSGLLFKGYTPFQAALCTWNTALCKEFKKYFNQIPNGLAIMQAQIKKIFPKGLVAHIDKQKKGAQEFADQTLRPLINIISAASDEDVQTMLRKKQSDSELGKAMTAFRETIKTLSGADPAPVHNPFYLQAAFDLYVKCYDSFNSWHQKDLFCVQVIGGIQCHSPAYDLQAFTQGLWGLVEDGKSHLESFKFTNNYDDVTHLEIKDGLKGLGYEYWAAGGAWAAARLPGGREIWLGSLEVFEIYIEQKIGLNEFYPGSRATSGQLQNSM